MQTYYPSRSINQKRFAISSPTAHKPLVHLRLRVYVPTTYRGEPIFSRLSAEYGLTFNITYAIATPTLNRNSQFDLELTGTLQQVQAGLMYLASLPIKVISKANSHGDSWHY